MKSKLPRYAGIVAAILAITLIAGLFAIFGTVDLIFVKDGYEVKRTENVSVLSEIDLYTDIDLYTEEGAKLQYTYEFDGAEYVIDENQANLREHIVYTVLLNAITFKWGAEDNDITVTVE